MKRTIKLILLIAILTACNKKMDFKLKDASIRLAVEGRLTNEKKIHTIKLTNTANYFSTDASTKAEGAKVELYDGNSTVQLKEVAPGIYQTDSTYQGIIGKTYTLKIDYKSERFTSISTLLPIFNMDSIGIVKIDSVEYNPINGGSPATNSIVMYAQNQTIDEAYYIWNLYINDKLITDTLSKIQFANNSVLDYNSKGDRVEMPIYEYPTLKPGDIVKLEIGSISKSYFDFLISIRNGISIGSPFATALSNSKGNIKNLTNLKEEVMGFFVTSAVSSSFVQVK